jgi:hypothetical protein
MEFTIQNLLARLPFFIFYASSSLQYELSPTVHSRSLTIGGFVVGLGVKECCKLQNVDYIFTTKGKRTGYYWDGMDGMDSVKKLDQGDSPADTSIQIKKQEKTRSRRRPVAAVHLPRQTLQ